MLIQPLHESLSPRAPTLTLNPNETEQEETRLISQLITLLEDKEIESELPRNIYIYIMNTSFL